MTNKKRHFSLVMVLFWFSLYAYLPQMATYAQDLGASYKLIGLITGAYGFTQTILRIPFGILSDKLMNRKVFIIIGVVSAILSSSIVYILPNPYTLLIARLLAGVAAATWVNFTVLFLSYFLPTESSKSVGIATSNSKIGQVLAMFIGGYIAWNFGIRNIFLMCMVIGIVALIFGLFIYEDESNVKNKSNESVLLSLIKNRRILHISFLGCMIQFITYSTTFGFTPIIAANLGANNLELSYLSVTYVIPQILFSVLSGTLFASKFGERKTLLMGFILSVLICVLTPFSPSIRVLYIIQFFSGIGNVITFTMLMGMVVRGVKDHLMSTTMGLYQAAYGVGMILGPIILGSIGDYFGLTSGFIVVGVLGLLSIWSVLSLTEV